MKAMTPCDICAHRPPRDIRNDEGFKCAAYPEGIPRNKYHSFKTGMNKPCNPKKPEIRWEIEEERKDRESILRERFLKK